MKYKHRNFIKNSAIAFGAPHLNSLYSNYDEFEDDDCGLLKNVCDIHVHASPDTKGRAVDEIDFVLDAKNAGYRAVMYKSNAWSCHDRAFLVRCAVSEFECFGSLCMNACVGDKVNVRAAELAIETAGNFCKCIWMPTVDSVYQNESEGRNGIGIPVLNRDGVVLPEVVRVMEICAKADIIFATGHSSPHESLIMAKKAKEIGVSKFVVTHANSLIWKLSEDKIKELIDLGAFIEFSYLPCLWGAGTKLPEFDRMPEPEFISFVKINPERSFVSTDLGQVGMPNPISGMRNCIELMLNSGVSKHDVDMLVRENPAKLLGLGKSLSRARIRQSFGEPQRNSANCKMPIKANLNCR